jgi:adenylate cyclase
VDFEAEGLLEGLDGEDRRQREQLLERLAEDGFKSDELCQAVKENRLALLPVDRVLGGSYSAEQVAEKTGLDAEKVTRIRRLLGLSVPEVNEQVFSEEDLEASQAIKMFLDAGFDEERIGEITRVLGEGMGRLTATIAAAFAETYLKPGDSEADVAFRFASLAEELTPAVTPLLVAAFRDHLHGSVQRGMLGLTELQTGDIAGSQDLAVCFADLVGFTRLGGQVEVRELGTVADRLAREAASLTEAPVRLIKTIGDAAMFVSPEPEPLVGVALDLVRAFEEEDLPSLRAGIAFGPAFMRTGDYYGNSVNLASRVTGIARPGSVLCTDEIRDAADSAYNWSSTGKHKLKGVSGPITLYRARPLEADESEDDDDARKPRGGRSRKRASR